MSSVNITITHDPLAAELYATDRAPYTVSGWFTDRTDGTLVTAERHGIDPVRLLGELLNDLSIAAGDLDNLRAPEEVVEADVVDIDIEEYVK
jgi:hypothetical protein